MVSTQRLWKGGYSAWKNEDNFVLQSMEYFCSLVAHWNKMCFGNKFRCKKVCMAILEGVQKKLAEGTFRHLKHLETELLEELNDLLKFEESYWNQEAKV